MGPMSAEIGEEATVQMTCMAAPSLHKAAWPYPPCTGLHGCAIVLKAVLRSCISSLPIHYTHTLADTHTHTHTCKDLCPPDAFGRPVRSAQSVVSLLGACVAGLLCHQLHAHTWSASPSFARSHMVCFAVNCMHTHGLFCRRSRTHKV